MLILKISEQGFVLQRIAYSDTSSVLKCFTQQFGLKSFLLQGAKKKFPHLIQPFSPIEFSFNLKNHDQLAKMYNPCFFYQASDIPFQTLKSSIVFFQTELLINTLYDGQADQKMYRFLADEYRFLDQQDYHPNYLIYWLFELISILGFDPTELDVDESLNSNSPAFLGQLTYRTKEEWLALNINQKDRQKIIQGLLAYYQMKIPNFKPIKTLEVYQSIW